MRKLLLALTLLGLLPLAVLAGLSIHTARQAYNRQVEQSTLDLARAVASAVNAELEASIWAVSALAQSNEFARRDFAALHQELSRYAKTRDDVVGVNVSDSQGRVFLRSNAPVTAEPITAVEPESLQAVIASLEPRTGTITKGRSGEFAYPVRVPVTGQGDVTYVLTAAFRPQRIKQIVDSQQRPNDWVISVFDSKLQRVARSRDHENTLGGAPAPSLRELLVRPAKEGSAVTRALEGDQIVTGYARLERSGWIVAVGAPISLISDSTLATVRLYLIGAGGSLLLSIALAVILSRRIENDFRLVVRRSTSIGTAEPGSADKPVIRESVQLMNQVEFAHQRVVESLRQAAEAGAAKDEFLAVLGHELRNPLAPIVNVLSIMDVKAPDSFVRERQILRRQVTHMTRLVDDLLDVSKLVRGEITVHLKPLDLGALVADVGNTFRQHEPSVDLAVSIPKESCQVSGDAIRLAQMATNLLVNAHRHGKGERINLRLSTRIKHACIEVTDHGEGMDQPTLSKIFEPFYQARQNPGSLGLGLPIVQAIVKAHGGTITAHSDGLGTGSTFLIELPLLSASG